MLRNSKRLDGSRDNDSLFLEDVRLCCYPYGTSLGDSTSFYHKRLLAMIWIATTSIIILTITLLINYVSSGTGPVASRLFHRVFRVARILDECPFGSVMYCPMNKMCITDKQRCDRFQDCPDDRDETNCTCKLDEFRCPNARCISMRFLCDKVSDCPSGDDESDKICGKCPDDSNYFRCKEIEKCIGRAKVCNGRVECPAADDELNCVSISKSFDLTLTHRGIGDYRVCARNWTPQTADNICRYLGFNNSERYWKYRGNHSKLLFIDGFPNIKYRVIIKSSTKKACLNEEFVKLKCSSEEMCGTRKFRANEPGQYIINGIVSSLGQWPWHARLQCSGKRCGSSIVGSLWVVTAAHCLYDNSKVIYAARECIVSYGSVNVYDSKWTDVRVQEIKIYPNYTSKRLEFDIALLKLTSPVRFGSNAKPICLPSILSKVRDFRLCVGIGFGKTIKGDLSPVLLHSKMLEYESSFCLQKNRNFPSRLCIGTRPGLGNPNICMGDSGSPFICQQNTGDRWFLLGVNSHVIGEGRANPEELHKMCQSGVASRVPYYLEWIWATMKEN